MSEVITEQNKDQASLLQSLSEVEDETGEESESSLAEDFEHLQLYSSNETLKRVEKQMSAKSSVLRVDKSESDVDSSFQSFVNAGDELPSADPESPDSEYFQSKSSVENSLMTDGEVCLDTSKESVDDNNSNETKLKSSETKLDGETSNAAHAETAESPNSPNNTITPRSILSQYSIEILSYVFRNNDCLLDHADIFGTLQRYANAFDKNTHLTPIGSAFYQITSPTSDFNILVTTGEFNQLSVFLSKI